MFKFKTLQRQDLARGALHDGLIPALDTGLGKSIYGFAWALLKVGWEKTHPILQSPVCPPHAAAARDRPTAADCPGVARRARRPAPTARPRRLGEIPRGYPRAGIAGRLPAPLCYEPLPHLDATGIRATWRRWNTRRRPVWSPRRRLAACCNNRFSAIFMQKAQRIHECVFENRTFSTGC